MNKKIRILISIILFIMMILALHNISYAADGVMKQLDGMKSVSSVDGAGTSKGIGKIINIAIGILQVVGTGISVIVVTLLGIKYVIASAQEKADLKKQAVPIIIGCSLLFAGSNIAAIIATMGSNI